VAASSAQCQPSGGGWRRLAAAAINGFGRGVLDGW